MSGSHGGHVSRARARRVVVAAATAFVVLLVCLLATGAAPAWVGPGAGTDRGDSGTLAERVEVAGAPDGGVGGPAASKRDEFKPREVIVRFAANATPAMRKAADRRAGAASVARLGRAVPGLSKVKLKAGVSVEAAVAAYRSQPGVLYAEPVYKGTIDVVPDDELFGSLWGLDNTGQDGGVPDADIDAPEAWDTTTGSAEVVVAVIDTGIDYTHPDLAPNMWTNPGEVVNGLDDDGNGYVDDVYGIDTVNGDSDPFDDHGHGTHCAGTIGAQGDDGRGVAGVNWDVRLMAVKWIGADGWGYTDGAIEAIEYAYRMGAHISSNSWHIFEYSQAMYDTIAALDAPIVFAAGNDSMDTDVWMNIPSAYDLPNIIAVGASNRYDDVAWFSNYGLTSVDLFAPGEDVLSSVPGSSYGWYSGTSMATPHVAGVAALLLAVDPAVDWRTLKLALLGSTEGKPAFSGRCVSGGRLNADLALEVLAAPPGTVSGRILSPQGDPVAGATVSLGGTLHTTSSDDGAYAFAGVVAGRQSIIATHPDYLATVVEVDVPAGGEVTLDVHLEPAAKIAGTVTSASSGEPVAGIEVTAYRQGFGGWEPVSTVATSGDGTYLIGGLRADPSGYRIGFSDPHFDYAPEFYDDARSVEEATDVPVAAGETTYGIDAALAEYGRIAGTVAKAADGAPLEGVYVTAYRQWGDYWEPVNGAVTGPDGSYTVGGLESGLYRVEFFDWTGTYAYEFYDDAVLPARATPVSVTLGETTAGIDAALSVGGAVVGTVTSSATGDPLPDVYVNVYRNNAGSWEAVMMGAVTDADGRYTLGGLPTGAYKVEFSPWSGEYAHEFYDGKDTLRTATAVGVRAGGTTRGVDGVLDPTGRITGAVTAASDGSPVPAVWVTAYKKVGTVWEWYSGAETLEDGTYAIEGLPGGTYRVEFLPYSDYAPEFYDDKRELAKATNVTVTAGSTTSGIDARLELGGAIAGRITSAADGSPVSWAFVILYRNVGGSWEPFWGTQADPEGWYEVRGLAAGAYRIEFLDQFGVYAGEFYDNQTTVAKATSVVVALGSTTGGIDAALDPAGAISGTVTAEATGEPIQYAYVLLYRNVGGRWREFAGAETGPDGSYTLGGLATGTYRVQFIAPWDGVFTGEFYDDKPTLSRATDVRVISGATTGGIDAALATSVSAPTGDRTVREASTLPGLALPAVTLSAEAGLPAARDGRYFVRDAAPWTATSPPAYVGARAAAGLLLRR